MNEVEYWLDLAKYDLETAKAMYKTQRYLYVGFMCHQVVEKALKGYYSSKFDNNPPYTHNLALLAEKSGLYSEMNEEQRVFFDFLEPLNIQARYPTVKEKILAMMTEQKCQELILKTESQLKWVMTKL